MLTVSIRSDAPLGKSLTNIKVMALPTRTRAAVCGGLEQLYVEDWSSCMWRSRATICGGLEQLYVCVARNFCTPRCTLCYSIFVEMFLGILAYHNNLHLFS